MNEKAIMLALEALEFIPKSGSMLGVQAEEKRLQAIFALKEAWTEQKLSEPCRCGKQTTAWCMANTCSKASLTGPACALKYDMDTGRMIETVMEEL